MSLQSVSSGIFRVFSKWPAGVKGEGMASGLSANNLADQISVVVVELRLSARVAKGRGFDSPGYTNFFSLIPVGRTHCEGVES